MKRSEEKATDRGQSLWNRMMQRRPPEGIRRIRVCAFLQQEQRERLVAAGGRHHQRARVLRRHEAQGVDLDVAAGPRAYAGPTPQVATGLGPS